MGTLFYAGESKFSLEDRLLAHLQVVIGMKLRRSESFFLAWTVPTDGSKTSPRRAGATLVETPSMKC